LSELSLRISASLTRGQSWDAHAQEKEAF
jgi:hypothetical protein